MLLSTAPVGCYPLHLSINMLGMALICQLRHSSESGIYLISKICLNGSESPLKWDLNSFFLRRPNNVQFQSTQNLSKSFFVYLGTFSACANRVLLDFLRFLIRASDGKRTFPRKQRTGWKKGDVVWAHWVIAQEHESETTFVRYSYSLCCRWTSVVHLCAIKHFPRRMVELGSLYCMQPTTNSNTYYKFYRSSDDTADTRNMYFELGNTLVLCLSPYRPLFRAACIPIYWF